MKRVSWTSIAAVALLLGSMPACGSKQKPAESADDSKKDDKVADDAGTTAATDAAAKPPPCSGFEMDLLEALGQSACTVPDLKPDAKPQEVKGILDVTVMALSNRVVPGGHMDLVVTFTNKSPNPLPLTFLLDPEPRFQIEATSVKKSARVDVPPGNQPPVPDGIHRPDPSTPTTGRITLAANGKATVKLGWDATKMKWAPEKLMGTPVEQGYPKAPAGPLPKGKYILRVVTPLIGVFEGVDHEVSAPHTQVEVTN